LAITTSSTIFKVRITPKTHANMPAVPGASFATTGTVTGWTGTNAHLGTDGASAVITIDNLSPGAATSMSAIAGNAKITFAWTAPSDADAASAVLLRWTAATPGAEVPVEGTVYTAGTTITTATVACVIANTSSQAISGIVDGTGGTAGCTTVALTNGTQYSYKIFEKDSNGNYDAGTNFTGTPFTPVAPITTTLSDGTNPGNSTVAPSSAITDLYAFTVIASTGTDSITALTVTLAAGTGASLSDIRITSDNGSVLYFAAVANPSDTVNFSGGTPIPVTTSAIQFKVRMTPKTHANMPAVPGSSYAVTGTVTAWTGTNSHVGTDAASATITVDNLSPNPAT
jgi:hypothetical protein